MSEHEADLGHTWRITIEERPSTKVAGEPHHKDGDHFAHLPRSVEVRAWNLPDALRGAAAVPLACWFEETVHEVRPFEGKPLDLDKPFYDYQKDTRSPHDA